MSLHSHVESWKVVLIDVLSLTRDSLHIHIGLLIFFGVALIWRLPLQSRWPWLVACAVALSGEVVDISGALPTFGYWQVTASVHDVVNTLFWPTTLALLARFTEVMRRHRSPVQNG